MGRDYTVDQPVVESLQDALDLALGAGRLSLGGQLRVESVASVVAVLQAAHRHRGRVTVTGAHPERLALDLSGLCDVRDLDAMSGLVTVEVGVTPDALEQQLQTEGFTLGAGWFSEPEAPLFVALDRNEIEPLVVSVGAVLADGTLFHTPVAPRRATGPNPDALLLGTESRFGVVVWVTLRIRRRWSDVNAATFKAGGTRVVEAVRQLFRSEHAPFEGQLKKDSKGRVTARLLFRGRARCEAATEILVGQGLEKVDAAADWTLPSSAPKRVGWRQLKALCKGRRHSGLWGGRLHLHGGWVRLLEERAEEPRLEDIQRALDPLGTLVAGAHIHPGGAE